MTRDEMTPEELRADNDRILILQIMALCKLEPPAEGFSPTATLEVVVPAIADTFPPR